MLPKVTDAIEEKPLKHKILVQKKDDKLHTHKLITNNDQKIANYILKTVLDSKHCCFLEAKNLGNIFSELNNFVACTIICSYTS